MLLYVSIEGEKIIATNADLWLCGCSQMWVSTRFYDNGYVYVGF